MLYAIVAIIAIILDQVVKYLVETHVVLNAVGDDLVHLIPGVIHITNVHNIGGAFNMLQGARWLFIIVCIVFVLVVVFVLARGIIKTPLARWMAVFVLAGAVGNCIDRIICGYVVDMFELEFFRFPVFNLADIFITLGAIIFCLCVLLEKPQPEPPTEIDINEIDDPTVQPEALPEEKTRLRFGRREKGETLPYPARARADEMPIDPSDPFAEWENRAKEPEAPRPAAPVKSEPVVYTRPEAQDGPDTSELIWKDDEPAKADAIPSWPVPRGADSEPVPGDDDVKPFKLHITPEARTAPAADGDKPFRVELPKQKAPAAAPAPAVKPAPAAKPAANPAPAPAAKPAAKPAPAPAAKPAPAPAPAAKPADKPVVIDDEPDNTAYNIDDILAEFLDD